MHEPTIFFIDAKLRPDAPWPCWIITEYQPENGRLVLLERCVFHSHDAAIGWCLRRFARHAIMASQPVAPTDPVIADPVPA